MWGLKRQLNLLSIFTPCPSPKKVTKISHFFQNSSCECEMLMELNNVCGSTLKVWIDYYVPENCTFPAQVVTSLPSWSLWRVREDNRETQKRTSYRKTEPSRNEDPSRERLGAGRGVVSAFWVSICDEKDQHLSNSFTRVQTHSWDWAGASAWGRPCLWVMGTCLPLQLYFHSLLLALHSASLEFLQVREHTKLSPATWPVPCCFLCWECCFPRSLHGHFILICSSNVTSWSWSCLLVPSQ